MRCIRPLKASQRDDLSITFSSKDAIPGLLAFEIECRKCLPCRLNMAREKAIRTLHEAKTHEDNIFLTLTYNEENLTSPKLIYEDFQLFMKRLRKTQNQKITYMVTGEYGDKNKRPHWHAIIFNYTPNDSTHKYTTQLDDIVYTSKTLTKLWGKGNIEYGSVTMESAGYVARYAAKKLCHGKDQDHEYHPIHKTSSKRAIGRSWIEKYYKQTFENGYVHLPNGQQAKIPRYYVDWAKIHQPESYNYYVTQIRPTLIQKAELNKRTEEMDFHSSVINQREAQGTYPLTRSKIKHTILKSKFKQLQERLKL